MKEKDLKMRTWVKLALIFGMAVTVIACGSDKKRKSKSPPTAPIPGGPYVPPGSGPGAGPGDSWQYGGTAPMTITNISNFSEYIHRPANKITDLQININLTKTGNNSWTKNGGWNDDTYGGTVTIGYNDDQNNDGTKEYHEGYFTSGATEETTPYNFWEDFPDSDGVAFHAMFEDFLGGLVIVIDDDGGGLGDGGGTLVSGSVWFKNFDFTNAPHPPTYCWFVSLGPYDCRAWPSDDDDDDFEDRSNPYMSLMPKGGYKKLGNFTGLDLEAAFNGEL